MTATEVPLQADAVAASAGSPQPRITPARRLLGDRGLSAAVYGSLLVLTLIVAQARSSMGEPFVTFTLFVAVGVFWIAEAWSELIAVRLAGPVTMRQGARVMAGELPMIGAAILPALALMTRSLGLTTASQAIDLALAVGVAQLFVWGLAVGRALGRGWTVTLLVALADVALGLVIVALKVFVVH
jgi:hypothetical protein